MRIPISLPGRRDTGPSAARLPQCLWEQLDRPEQAPPPLLVVNGYLMFIQAGGKRPEDSEHHGEDAPSGELSHHDLERLLVTRLSQKPEQSTQVSPVARHQQGRAGHSSEGQQLMACRRHETQRPPWPQLLRQLGSSGVDRIDGAVRSRTTRLLGSGPIAQPVQRSKATVQGTQSDRLEPWARIPHEPAHGGRGDRLAAASHSLQDPAEAVGGGVEIVSGDDLDGFADGEGDLSGISGGHEAGPSPTDALGQAQRVGPAKLLGDRRREVLQVLLGDDIKDGARDRLEVGEDLPGRNRRCATIRSRSQASSRGIEQAVDVSLCMKELVGRLDRHRGGLGNRKVTDSEVEAPASPWFLAGSGAAVGVGDQFHPQG